MVQPEHLPRHTEGRGPFVRFHLHVDTEVLLLLLLLVPVVEEQPHDPLVLRVDREVKGRPAVLVVPVDVLGGDLQIPLQRFEVVRRGGDPEVSRGDLSRRQAFSLKGVIRVEARSNVVAVAVVVRRNPGRIRPAFVGEMIHVGRALLLQFFQGRKNIVDVDFLGRFRWFLFGLFFAAASPPLLSGKTIGLFGNVFFGCDAPGIVKVFSFFRFRFRF
mmetsp:Transcript_779/g.1648  ORF Transcript_779/g.1648 Transcript_779/m.1648 type:complete len:216 (-) Transcript_779:1905-2552(-)